MDKNAIKKFAVCARRELISRVSQRAAYFEITGAGFGDPAADIVLGRVLSDEEKAQRQALIAQIQQKGYQQVMEEVAYTWFNRFIALRFMEVNGYLPSHVRVFTDEANQFNPQILAEAIHMELDGLDMQKVYAFKNANDDDGLFKYMVIVQCNALSTPLPGMFQRISDYTELLFPDNLLREGSVLQQMIALIPEEDWKDAVQIIGWLYQYYNAEKKDEVFAALKKNVKITKENIPAATQLFTPDWIVRYMVENSLGRLWLEHLAATGEGYHYSYGDNGECSAAAYVNADTVSALKGNWKYYLDEATQEPEVQAQLAEIRKGYATMTPEQIKCIDPCCGSGHILAYLFDVLMQIYESYGYTTREAVASIVQNNLYGLDIDDRAAQLAYFAVMMKARQYDRRFFSRGIQPHVYAIQNSKPMPAESWGYLGEEEKVARRLWDAFADAKEYGSLVKPEVTLEELDQLQARLVQMDERSGDGSLFTMTLTDTALDVLCPLIELAQVLVQKYDVVVTNPPYMGSSGMGGKLADFVKKNYPDSKSDLFGVFIEACGNMTKKNGYQAIITQHAWMFLSSFEKLRTKLLQKDTINMAHLGARAFDEIGGEVVQTTSFVMQNSHITGYKSTYCRLIEPTTQKGKENMFLEGENRYTAQQSNFSKIPGSPVAYWVDDAVYDMFDAPPIMGYFIPKFGMSTGDGEKFVRFWYEESKDNIAFDCDNEDAFSASNKEWCVADKGGNYRRWYGNKNCVIWWKNNGADIKSHKKSAVRSPQYFFRPHISWTLISSGVFSARYFEKGFLLDTASNCLYYDTSEKKAKYALGYLNSKVASYGLNLLNPTINMSCGVLGNLPYIEKHLDEISSTVSENIRMSKHDWDTFETSWDFKQHPLVRLRLAGACAWGGEQQVARLSSAYQAWELECEGRFQKLKSNEEELNRIFIDIYSLQDELTPEVADKDVTVHYLVDTKDEIPESLQGSNYVLTRRDAVVSMISYAVGCMFGRYTIYADGLLYAGGPGWHHSLLVEKIQDLLKAQGKSMFPENGFYPDEDNVIPICDDEYFDDDIVGRFVKFIEAVYGSDTLEENLKFIADALGGKGTPRDVIRSYFLNDFYADHCKAYQKRPIYWLFDSGKKNGFKALIYIHRYQPDTIARIRTDYVHEQQSRYRTAIADLESRIASASTAERVKLNKQLKKLQEQDAELRTYEEKIHHLADQMISIDLDDGVKVNYAKFQDVLGKIK